MRQKFKPIWLPQGLIFSNFFKTFKFMSQNMRQGHLCKILKSLENPVFSRLFRLPLPNLNSSCNQLPDSLMLTRHWCTCVHQVGQFSRSNLTWKHVVRLRCTVCTHQPLNLTKPLGEIKKEMPNKKPALCAGLLFGSPCWTWTNDSLINSQVLYRLS